MMPSRCTMSYKLGKVQVRVYEINAKQLRLSELEY